MSDAALLVGACILQAKTKRWSALPRLSNIQIYTKTEKNNTMTSSNNKYFSPKTLICEILLTKCPVPLSAQNICSNDFAKQKTDTKIRPPKSFRRFGPLANYATSRKSNGILCRCEDVSRSRSNRKE